MSLDVDIQYDLSSMKAYLLDRELKFVGWFKRFLGIQIKLLARDLKRDMKTGKKSGRWYMKSNGGGRYRASAKGETPAVDTGKLLRSVKITKKAGGLEWEASTGTDYVEELIDMKRAFFKPFFDRRKPLLMSSLREGGFLN